MAVRRQSQHGATIPEDERYIPVERWAGVEGAWHLDGGKATFLGQRTSSRARAEVGHPPLGLAVSDVSFRDGCARVSVNFEPGTNRSAGFLLGYDSPESAYYMATLGGYEKAYSVSEYQPGRGWVPLGSAGLWPNLGDAREFDLEVRVMGQSLSLSVDGIRVMAVNLTAPLRPSSLGLFAWGDSDVTFHTAAVAQGKPRLFVIMPFSEPFDTLYREVIKPVAVEAGLDFAIIRVDEVQAPGIILEDIQRQIAESHAVVAEISSPNPNVFYELGYAHALGKPAILLVRRPEASGMPFDIRGYRAIFYDDTIGGKRQVERLLRQHLSAVLGRATAVEIAS